MTVAQVRDGMRVESNRVYVVPPNATMTIRKGTLRLVPRVGPPAKYMPIDHFLRALAEDQQENAIGVILSGIASDGTEGLRAVKAHGGITFAQDPDSAKQSGMPLSAIQSGCVDSVAAPAKIAVDLLRLRQGFRIHKQLLDAGQHEEVDDSDFQKVIGALRRSTGVDFNHYKPNTIRRRIARRMALLRVASLAKYAQLLRAQPVELDALYSDIFIPVTGFFRNPEAFAALRAKVIRKIAKAANGSPTLRVWVAGCSTGEEVYSIAILLLEELGDAGGRKVQIFGTDILEQAVEKGRAGIYPESSLAGLSAARLQRFFVKVNSGYQVAKFVRERCVFARHDLTKDPPFSKLDLIACRNVLIYLGAELQKRVMEVFHYALKPNGTLFLGKSESIGGHGDLFTLRDRKQKIYSHREILGRHLPAVRSMEDAGTQATRQGHDKTHTKFDQRKEIDGLIVARYSPPVVVVDSDFQIIEARGDTSAYLSLPSGQANLHLLRMARPEFVLDLRTCIHRAKKLGVAVRKQGISFEQDGHKDTVSLEVVPMPGRQAAKPDFLVVFEAGPHQAVAEEGRGSRHEKKRSKVDGNTRLKQELASTRQYLRSVVEDQEAANEEMKAANEEVLSSNEELQSTNEELETAKEELQSTNEELTTLNEELQNRNAELDHLTNDLSNLLVGVEIPILIVGGDRRIRRFTPAAEKVFNLISSDVGRPIGNIKPNFDLPDFERWISEVITKLHTVEKEVQDNQGRWYSLRMLPYKTSDNRIDGVLIALGDIHLIKRQLEITREARDQAQAIVQTVREPLVLLNERLEVSIANRAFYDTFPVQPKQTEGRSIFQIGGGQWDIPKLRELLERVLPDNKQVVDYEVEQEFPALGRRRFILNARQVQLRGLGWEMILLAIEDVSDVRNALERSEEVLRLLAETASDIISLHDSKGRYLYVSPSIEKQLGYTPESLLGTEPSQLAHPEERKLFRRQTMLAAMKTAKETVGTYRIRKSSGGYAWFEWVVNPIFNDEGRPVRVRAAARDVTGRIEAQQALRDSQTELKRLAAGLIQAQEEERQRIARDLHDDFNQRLGLLDSQLAELERRLPASATQLRKTARELQQQAGALADDATRLAYGLHPSIVEHLGLVPALRSLCDEFLRAEQLQVEFVPHLVPKSIPHNVSLCLYRVAQEGLRNVARHSGSKRARVVLRGLKGEVGFSIADDGVGFDTQSPRVRQGLGLVGMQERLHAVAGSLTIQTQPGSGTQIDVRVPLSNGEG